MGPSPDKEEGLDLVQKSLGAGSIHYYPGIFTESKHTLKLSKELAFFDGGRASVLNRNEKNLLVPNPVGS